MILTKYGLSPGTHGRGPAACILPISAIGDFVGPPPQDQVARYHRRSKEPGWRRRLIAITFPMLVFALIRLNREYRAEAECLASWPTARRVLRR